MVRRNSVHIRYAWLVPPLVVGLLLGWLTIGSLGNLIGGDSPASPTKSDAYTGTELDGPAAEFELVDQHGEPVALSDFRGDVVVLAFLDPNCTDVCPLTALHFRQAYDALEPTAADAVAFLAITVNVEANEVADVASASEKWGMHELPNWHFLTGDEEALRDTLQAYDVEAQPDPNKRGEVTHTPGVIVIDPAGDQRWYVSTPLTDDREWDGPVLSDVLQGHIYQLLHNS